ncbi:MAG TPA: two-component regulator propeller domain-containing protein, partial [Prolixibacteraceae bacterium]|nr:two-component regulator propeller domain-containing protein [Prolixibacteraceae bacterium]
MFKTNCLLFLLTFLSISVLADSVETYSNLRFKSISTHEGLSQSSVLSIAQDAQGLVWMGTKDGLNRFDGYRFVAYKNVPNDNNSISNNEVIFLLPDKDGNLFVGTRGGGLNLFVKDENRFVRFDNLKTLDGTVTYIHRLNNGAIWVGTNQGLFLGVPDSTTKSGYHFANYSNKSVFLDQQGGLLAYDRDIVSVVSVYEMSEKQLLIGTFKGLFLFKKDDLSFVQVELGKQNNAKVNSIVADENNLIWVGTSEGLVRFTRTNNNELKLIPQNNQPEWKQLNSGWVERLLIDNEGDLWVGTRGAGIMLIDKKGMVSEFFTSNILSNKVGDNIINSLMIDRSDVLWMGTESKGVVTLDLKRKKFNHLDNHSYTGR